MNKIKVRNFGPIKEGALENEGWIEIQKVTVFIGTQGSGKSTIAKLISTLLWIEKALVRGDIDTKNLTESIFKKHCGYQNIGNFFKPNTFIAYQGKAVHIIYENKTVKVFKNEEIGYSFPKIMYVPSERNFVSSVKNVRTLKGLPSALYTFSDEFINAIEALKGQLELPINDSKFEYQKLNKLSSIIGKDYKINLSESSSGFQSFVPLFVVSNFLSNFAHKNRDNSTKEISIEDEKKIRKEIEIILSNPNISDDVKQASLEFLSSKFSYASFINIVEEPEQNLFPDSQFEMLKSLLAFNNVSQDNGLILTTHSPYIINFLSIAIQANYVLDQNKVVLSDYNKDAIFKLNNIIPQKSMISGDNVAVYELDESNGTMKKLLDFEGIPSDDNFLNTSLAKANDLFDLLLEIEQELCE